MTTRSHTTGSPRRRRRLKKPVRRFLTAAGLLLAVVMVVGVAGRLLERPGETVKGPGGIHFYKDLNAVHLKHARAVGISPLKGKDAGDQAAQLAAKGKLVAVSDNKYYVVNHLTHSYPYLVPEAARVLELIGKRFREKLEEKDMEPYYFRVTSLLRTGESQRRLRGSNGNATNQSAHLYGTTFDITYKNLVRKNLLGRRKTVTDAAALRLLSETIGELRKEKRLVVVTEKREACFHITVCR